MLAGTGTLPKTTWTDLSASFTRTKVILRPHSGFCVRLGESIPLCSTSPAAKIAKPSALIMVSKQVMVILEYAVVSPQKGPQDRAQNSILLIIGAPKMESPIFGPTPYVEISELVSGIEVEVGM